MGNKNLRKAKRKKNDEFYTRIEDIEREVHLYKDQLKDKVIFCNCDDPEESNFWRYFYLNFEHFGLKKLISTHYEEEIPSYKLEYDGENIIKTPLEQNGDFRSPEAVEILKESDIVVTNPPFSLFRSYVAQLMKYDKKFLVIGSMNAITYKEIFPLLKDNKMWLGHKTGAFEFVVPMDFEKNNTYIEDGVKYAKFGNITWFTNLENNRRNEELKLYKKYSPEEFPKYDNYEAINVDKVADIPVDFYGVIGVPITFLTKHNPNQFEIVDALNRYSLLNSQNNNEEVRAKKSHMCNIDGKPKYFRVIIKKKQLQ